jgi:uncharacterized protein YukE
MTTPADKPPPFPEAQAQTIRDWATKLNKPRATTLVDQIKEWLGNPDAVTAATRQWSPVATGAINESIAGLNTATTNAASYWEGRGADAFGRYSAQLEARAGGTRIPVQQVADTLRDSLNIIRDAYTAGVRLIADFAKQILEAGKSVPDILFGIAALSNPITAPIGIEQLTKGATSTILSILQAFITAVEDAATTYIAMLTQKTQAILKLESAESIVPVPDDAPVGLGDPDWWKPRKADDYDSPVPDRAPDSTGPGAPNSKPPQDPERDTGPGAQNTPGTQPGPDPYLPEAEGHGGATWPDYGLGGVTPGVRRAPN